MFKVTYLNCGEMDITSTNFSSIVFDISSHKIFYTTCNEIRHVLDCDFSSIFSEIYKIVNSEEFQNEELCEDCCDGDMYKFEYIYKGNKREYKGYIYGLNNHEKLIEIIESCAKRELDDEQKLLRNNFGKNDDNSIEDWARDILNHRHCLCEDFLDFWQDL